MEAGAEIQSGFLQEGGWHSELSKRIRKECLIWNNNSECCALWNCGRTGQNQDWSQQIFLWKHRCSLVFHSLYERLNILSALFSDGGTPRSPAIPSAASGVCYLSFLPQAEVRSEEVVTWHSWHNKDFPWGAASAWVSVALLYTQVLRLVCARTEGLASGTGCLQVRSPRHTSQLQTVDQHWAGPESSQCYIHSVKCTGSNTQEYEILL